MANILPSTEDNVRPTEEDMLTQGDTDEPSTMLQDGLAGIVSKIRLSLPFRYTMLTLFRFHAVPPTCPNHQMLSLASPVIPTCTVLPTSSHTVL